MTTPPQKTAPISILKAPPPSSMALPSPSSSSSVNRHAAHPIVLSEDEEDEDDLKYALSDCDDEELSYVPSGKALALLQTEKACYSGYLLKKGEKRRTWKKRWFVLRTTKLAMYKDKKEYKLLRIIDLHDIHSLVQVTSKNKYQHVFAIITPKRMYYVQADDQHTMEGWFDAVDRAKEELQHATTVEDDTANLTIRTGVTSYKSSSSSMQHHRRRSSGATTTVDTRRQSGGIATLSSSSSSSHTGVTFSHSPPTTITSPTLAPKPTSSLPENNSRSTPADTHPLKVHPSLGDYTVGHVYPISPTNDHAQVHFAEGIASSEDDEDYSATNSAIDVKKEESRNKVLMEGYLLKLGRNKGWQKRWFVLRTDTLAYYENEKEYSPHRIIPLDHISDTLEIEAISRNKQHCFKIIIPKRNYVLCASTKVEMEAWLTAFVSVSKKDNKIKITDVQPPVSTLSPSSPSSSSSSSSSSSTPSPTTGLHYHQYHQAMRLEQITEIDGQETGPTTTLVKTPSIDSFDNSSHISGAGGVGGAGGALGRH